MNMVPETVQTTVKDETASTRIAGTGISLADTRHDWSAEEVESLLALPFA
ncbi:MAG: biotin synthase, partial [Rhodospirillaceae bacterium]|nr:biotin synthase [Rhodospirillaceae bacterium]